MVSEISGEIVRRMQGVTGITITTPLSISDVLHEIVSPFGDRVRTLTLSLKPEEVFLPLNPEDDQVSPHLETLKEKGTLSSEGKTLISAFLLRRLLEVAESRRLVVQLMLGVTRPIAGASPPDYALVEFNPSQLRYLTQVFARFREVNFDLLVADPLLHHASAVIAKNYQNVYLTGYWWYSLYPEVMNAILRLRPEMLPYTKVGAFFSDAYVADWMIGKIQLAKRVLWNVLSELVRAGFLDPELALEVAEATLKENQRRLYGL